MTDNQHTDKKNDKHVEQYYILEYLLDIVNKYIYPMEDLDFSRLTDLIGPNYIGLSGNPRITSIREGNTYFNKVINYLSSFS